VDKGFFVYMLVFALLIGAAVTFGNMDQITPTIAQAQAEMAIGTSTVQVAEKGASVLLKLLLGATITGVAAAAFGEARKAYKTWQRNSRRGRWTGGPNAQWRQQPQEALPKLRREDLMLLALTGKLPANQSGASPRRGANRAQDEEEKVELEMPL
jgi:citrate lyase gamma subunit